MHSDLRLKNWIGLQNILTYPSFYTLMQSIEIKQLFYFLHTGNPFLCSLKGFIDWIEQGFIISMQLVMLAVRVVMTNIAKIKITI